MSITEQIREAEAEFRHMQAIENQRKAAEAAFVLAELYREAGDTEASKQYARESIILFTHAGGTDTLEGAAPRYTSLAGVHLPNLIHENVVRNTFSDYNL
jgi:hypothetical protein